jgi:hypothetical protein
MNYFSRTLALRVAKVVEHHWTHAAYFATAGVESAAVEVIIAAWVRN